MPYIDAFLIKLNALPDGLIYFLLGVSAFVENVFPPIPGDTITAFGAFLVGTQRLDFTGVYLSTTLGSLAGFMTLFWIGNVLGRRFFLERDYRFFKARDIIRAEEWFARWGYLLILLNRFFPGIRSAISIAGGISRLKALRVTLLALISAGIWNLLWIFAGYTLGTQWETVKEKMGTLLFRYNMGVFICLGLVILLLIIRFLKKRRKASSPGE
ncbi:MAG: DedA family protein [Deltaproteobacteria bacterium]|nr:DedA family protein [Deltaproteobacteria bacterium]